MVTYKDDAGKVYQSHYDWLKDHLRDIALQQGVVNYDVCYPGVVQAHGDKCWGFLRNSDIPRPHVAALYMLSRMRPVNDTLRDEMGEVRYHDLEAWMLKLYARIGSTFPKLTTCVLTRDQG